MPQVCATLCPSLKCGQQRGSPASLKAGCSLPCGMCSWLWIASFRCHAEEPSTCRSTLWYAAETVQLTTSQQPHTQPSPGPVSCRAVRQNLEQGCWLLCIHPSSMTPVPTQLLALQQLCGRHQACDRTGGEEEGPVMMWRADDYPLTSGCDSHLASGCDSHLASGCVYPC